MISASSTVKLVRSTVQKVLKDELTIDAFVSRLVFGYLDKLLPLGIGALVVSTREFPSPCERNEERIVLCVILFAKRASIYKVA